MSYNIFVVLQCILSNVHIEMELFVRFIDEKGEGKHIDWSRYELAFETNAGISIWYAGNVPLETIKRCAGRAVQSECQFENDIFAVVFE